MTPKEKAKELADKFEKVIPFKGFMFPNEIAKYKKQCALICVDEILLYEYLNIEVMGNSFSTVNWHYISTRYLNVKAKVVSRTEVCSFKQ